MNDFLLRCAREDRWRARNRGNAVYYSSQGKTVPEIAQQLKCSTDSVYRWLRRYQEKGIAGLTRSPRPLKLTPQQVYELREVSHWSAAGDKKRIKEYRMRWTFRQMAQWVKDKWGIKLSHVGVMQIVSPASRLKKKLRTEKLRIEKLRTEHRLDRKQGQ